MEIRIARRLLPALLPLLACSCSLRTVALRTTAGLIEAGAPALREESDAAFAREALPAQLKLLESLLQSDSKNKALLSSLSEGFVGYAFLFLEDENPDRAREMYRRALSYSLRLAALNPSLARLDAQDTSALDAALRRASSADVPGLYWAAYAWAGWANLAKGDPDALAGMARAARVMERVRALNGGYQFGGPDLFFGVYYAARPALAGGDVQKAKSYFESAVSRSEGKFLTAKLLYAQYQSVAALDPESFRRLLTDVLAADANALPEARLSNAVAQRKARKLLEKINDLF